MLKLGRATNPAVPDVLVLQVWPCEVDFNYGQITSEHFHGDSIAQISHSALCFSAFWVWAFANNFGKALCPCWLLWASHSRYHAEEEKNQCLISFIVVWFLPQLALSWGVRFVTSWVPGERKLLLWGNPGTSSSCWSASFFLGLASFQMGC